MNDSDVVAGQPELRVVRVIGHGGSGTVREVTLDIVPSC